MAGFNQTIILGNVGIAPELRYTPNGRAVTNMTVATNENFTNSRGDKVTHTEWHRVVIWGPLAETCAKFGCDKGNLVQVHGRLRTREWADERFKDAQGHPVKRYTTELVAQGVQFLTPRDQALAVHAGGEEPESGFEHNAGDEPAPY